MRSSVSDRLQKRRKAGWRLVLADGLTRALLGRAAASLTAGAAYVASSPPCAAAADFSCTASVIDRDTLRCAERGSDGPAIRMRLFRIAAREPDNSCTAGHAPVVQPL